MTPSALDSRKNTEGRTRLWAQGPPLIGRKEPGAPLTSAAPDPPATAARAGREAVRSWPRSPSPRWPLTGGRWPDPAAALPPFWGCPPHHRGRGVGPARSRAGSTRGAPLAFPPAAAPHARAGWGRKREGTKFKSLLRREGRKPGKEAAGGAERRREERGGSGRGVWKTLRERGSG